jgi:spermidine synthase
MAIEMAASRIFAPFFGTSLIVWASIIGVILGAMSLGSFFGGYIADKYDKHKKIIGNILSISALCIVFIAVIKNLLLSSLIHSNIIMVIMASILLFAPISALLCMITPIVLKILAINHDALGKTSGRLSAISTLGSIAGVFITSFVLIPLIGNAVTLIILAVILSAASFIFHRKLLQITAAVLSILLVFYPISAKYVFKNSVIEIDTLYGNYIITDNGSLVQLRSAQGIQSEKIKGDNTTLLSRYAQYYDLAFHFNEQTTDALCIGGAGFVYPQYFVEVYGNTNIDVVEIDPAMIKIAKKYFGLQLSDRLTAITKDGRSFLNKNTKKYDAIFGDAFNNLTPPYELLTIEATQKIYSALNDSGVYILNIISGETGQYEKVLKSVFATIAAVFGEDCVSAYRADLDWENLSKTMISNKVIIATKKPQINLTNEDSYLNGMLSARFTVEYNNYSVLTDDRASVDMIKF